MKQLIYVLFVVAPLLLVTGFGTAGDIPIGGHWAP